MSIRNHQRLLELGVTQMLISRARGGFNHGFGRNGGNIVVVYFLDKDNIERAHYFNDVTPYEEIVEYTRPWTLAMVQCYERVQIENELASFSARAKSVEALLHQ